MKTYARRTKFSAADSVAAKEHEEIVSEVLAGNSPSYKKPLLKEDKNLVQAKIPKQLYMRLMLMKAQSGRGVMELAAEAIKEYIENHQQEYGF